VRIDALITGPRLHRPESVPTTTIMKKLLSVTKIQAPVHNLHYWLRGDRSNCSYGVQVNDSSGETHQYGKRPATGG
jgi:hypothetical protein